MKRDIKILVLTTLAVVMISLGILIFDKPNKDEWQISEIKNDPVYSSVYSYDNCHIRIRTDNTGITITALNPNWHGKILTQTIIIHKFGNGDVIKVVNFTANSLRDGLALETTGYDIFTSKYLKKAKKLPPEIKELFFGFYNLR